MLDTTPDANAAPISTDTPAPEPASTPSPEAADEAWEAGRLAEAEKLLSDDASEDDETDEAADETAAEKSERLRNEKGQFTKADGDTPEAAEDDSDIEAAAPPQYLPAPLKEAWGKLDEPVRQAIAHREHQVSQAFSEQGSKLQRTTQFAQTLQGHLQPFEEHWSGLEDYFDGLGDQHPAQRAAELFQIDEGFRTDPLGTLSNLYRQSGYDPRQIIAHIVEMEGLDYLDLALKPVAPPAQPDRERLAMEQRTRKLERELRDRDHQADLAARQQHERVTAHRASQMQAIVEEFAREHPDVHDVDTEMAGLFRALQDQYPQAHPKQLLQEAYNRARYANPSTRAKLEAENARQAAVASRQAKTAAVVKARKTNAVNVTASHSNMPEPDFETERLEIARKHGLK